MPMRAEAAPLDRSAPHAARLRRDPRLPVGITCQIRVGSGPWRLASVVDISCSGFRIAWLPQCSAGRRLWIRFPGLEAMPASVQWRDLGGVGCQFSRPLHASVMDHLASAACF
jgi:hypothetical protein